MNRLASVVVALLLASAAWSQRVLATPDFSAFTASQSGGGYVSEMLPLPDGGYIVLGTFDAMVEGKLVRNVMRLRATGEPDPSWVIDRTNTLVSAVVTPFGVLFFDSISYVGGPLQANPIFVALSDVRLITPINFPDAARTIGGSYDATTGYVYVMIQTPNRQFEVRRFIASTQQIDPLWRILLSAYTGLDEYPGRPLADRGGGLWIAWVGTQCFNSCFTTKMKRFSIAEAGRELASIQTLFQREPLISGDFAYVDYSRYRLADGALDVAWRSAHMVKAVTRDFAYYVTSELISVVPDFAIKTQIRRASVGRTGDYDAWTLSLPTGPSSTATSYYNGFLIPWPTEGDNTNIAALVIARSAMKSNSALMIKDDRVGNEDPTVVEYYVPALKHYFMTGRKNDHAALDALPQSFTRTGMHFAAKSSRYRDIPEQPVCRLYASPERGGSNSHFYGIGDDCPTLNKLTGLKYEGYDFSVLKPTSSGCSADAPNTVSRLFNNKAASNDGNHRYVVSNVTKAKMMAQGWIDEGTLFCSASVTDAAN